MVLILSFGLNNRSPRFSLYGIGLWLFALSGEFLNFGLIAVVVHRFRFLIQLSTYGPKRSLNQREGDSACNLVGIKRLVGLFLGSYSSREGHSSSRLPQPRPYVFKR